eukprot:TRINITY_DN18646_c0_g1_i4.p1 TRINITY_DN18646_c0_g1~~TRINITY_DN18646_c0_g1_i4.p1  ORF type:complete len:776 (+),score=171.93 TRINITY_DN18646_c0_g1_i4:331-2658(+)
MPGHGRYAGLPAAVARFVRCRGLCQTRKGSYPSPESTKRDLTNLTGAGDEPAPGEKGCSETGRTSGVHAVEHVSSSASSTSPSSSGDPAFSGEQDSPCRSPAAGDDASEDGSNLATASSGTSSRSSSSSSSDSSDDCIQSAGAGAAVAQAPRRLRADPEQGSPLQVLPLSPRSSAADVSAMKEAPGAQPTAAPEKKSSLLSWLKQKATTVTPAARAPTQKGALSAVFSRPKKMLAPLKPRGAAGMQRHQIPKSLPKLPTPVLAPCGPRVKRPSRPGQQLCPSLTAMGHPRAFRAASTAEHAPPLGVCDIAVRAPSMASAASLQGSFSAEGTSPGHSPLPEHAPVRRLLPTATAESEQSAPLREQSVMLPLPVLWPPERSIRRAQSEQAASEDTASVDSEGFRIMETGEQIMGYEVDRLLGKGAFGAVWLATNPRTGGEVAIKVCKSGPTYHHSANIETQTLAEIDAFARATRSQRLKECAKHTVRMFSTFTLSGRGGAELPCMVFEALGPSLLRLMSAHDHRGVAQPIVKAITQQVLQALHFLAAMGLAHGDLKPENVLLGRCCRVGNIVRWVDLGAERLCGDYLPRRRGETLQDCLLRQYPVKLTDFGKAVFCQRQRIDAPIQTLEYRSPEVVNWTQELSPAVDMWSCGCMVFELVTGDYLFEVQDMQSSELDLHIKLWVKWIETVGRPPRSFTRPGHYRLAHKFFDAHGNLQEPAQPSSKSLLTRLKENDATKHTPQLKLLIDFISAMLRYVPGERVRPQDALIHKWLRIGDK